jgi:pimeloyl-ACP methyl ester carboxylesterase
MPQPDPQHFRSTNRVVLAYPGWLDNAGSFDRIAPLLVEQAGLEIVAIDPPGCGHSQHRPRSSIYSDHEEVVLLGELANALGIDCFLLMGHSRGGAMVALAAGVLQHRVRALICFDSGFALSGLWLKDLLPGAPNPAQRIANTLKTFHKNNARTVRVFASIQEAIEFNAANATFPKSEATARAIIMRQLRPCRGGWTFTHDQRTYGQAQWTVFSEEQTRDILSEITCPVLSITRTGRPHWPKTLPAAILQAVHDRKAMVPQLTELSVEGDHHVHSDRPDAVAAVVLSWLQRTVPWGDRLAGEDAQAPARARTDIAGGRDTRGTVEGTAAGQSKL